MATLIAVYNSDGLVGRCDAKCYNAANDQCDCVCGGANHGAGFTRAVENTRQMADQWIKEYTQAHGLESWLADVPAKGPVQLSFMEQL